MKRSKSPDRKELERLYREKYRPLYEEFASRLHALLEILTKDTGIPVDHIEYRVKTVESFMEKIDRKSYRDPFLQIKDCAGLRIVTFYQDSVDSVVKMLREEFAVDEQNSLDKIEDLGESEFGYRSVHLIVSLSHPRTALKEWRAFVGLSAEIQIRSVLQHAWAVVSHSLNYKVNAEVSRKLLRQLARLSANLESVDEEFTILHEKIAPERAAESSAEVSQDNPSALLNLESLRECLNQNVDLQKWERFGVKAGMEPFPQLVSKYQTTGLQILLLTLQAVGIATIAEFESLLPEFEKVGEQLRRFVELVRAKDETLYAVPVDVLVLLVSFVKASVLPADFAWGEAYEPFFIEALRNVMTAKSKVTGRRGAGRRKKK